MTQTRSLITGATGLLGSHLTELLLSRGQHPRLLVLPGEKVPWIGAEVHRGDLRDRHALEVALEDVDVVYHCAAVTGVSASKHDYQEVNVVGLQRLVEAVQKTKIRHLIHVSSITVHGNDVHGCADEDAPYRLEVNPYSRSKVAGEQLLARMVGDLGAPVTVVRPGWIYGPRDTASFARFAGLVARQRMVVIGSGRNHLPLIYASDAAEGLIRAATPTAVGRTYLLVNEEPVTQDEFLAAIATELGVGRPRLRIPYNLALWAGTVGEAVGRVSTATLPVTTYGVKLLGGENRYSCARARSELGFAPAVTMREGVRRSVAWLRASAPRLPA